MKLLNKLMDQKNNFVKKKSLPWVIHTRSCTYETEIITFQSCVWILHDSFVYHSIYRQNEQTIVDLGIGNIYCMIKFYLQVGSALCLFVGKKWVRQKQVGL
jgi:hypothetical protein